jgi:aspartyl-tRNA synthetase
LLANDPGVSTAPAAWITSITLSYANLAAFGQTVTLAGWVHRQRDHGGVTFIDLRDRFGWCRSSATRPARAAKPILHDARSEWVLAGHRRGRRRPAGAENPNLPTGEIEVDVISS